MKKEKEEKVEKVGKKKRHSVEDRASRLTEQMTKKIEVLYKKSLKLATWYEKITVTDEKKKATIDLLAALLNFQNKVIKK